MWKELNVFAQRKNGKEPFNSFLKKTCVTVTHVFKIIDDPLPYPLLDAVL